MLTVCLLAVFSGPNGANAQSGTPTLSVSTNTVSFGSVTVGQTAKQAITVSSTGNAPVTISGVSVAGSLFSASGITAPLTLNPGQTATLNLQFYSDHASSFTGILTIASNSSQGNVVVNMSGAGLANTPTLSVSTNNVSFGNVTVGQTAKQSITVSSTGNAPVTISGLSVAGSLFSASGVTAPITLNPGQTATLNLQFYSDHASSFTGILTIASNSSQGNVVVNMSGVGAASTGTLSVSSTNTNFGSVTVGQTATQSVTLTSTGSAPVTISGLSVVGSLFSASGITTPLTLNPGQTATLNLQFYSDHVSSFTGVLTIASNSSQGNVAVNMSGSGAVGLNAIYCTNSTIAGAGTDACTVSLSGPAPASGLAVSLVSNNTAVAIPGSVTIPANATTANFTATVSAVTSAQTATLTATAGSVSRSMSLQLNLGTPTLTASTTGVAFGSVVVGQTGKQSITLQSTGTGPVTISGLSVAGSLFSASGITTPLTLNPGQSTTLTLQFCTDHVSSFTGILTIASNSSQGNVVVNMSATGANHEIALNWNAPEASANQIAGYRIYRAPSGSSSFQVLNSTLDAQTSYTDATVQNTTSYEYYVTAVDSTGAESAPSNMTTISVP